MHGRGAAGGAEPGADGNVGTALAALQVLDNGRGAAFGAELRAYGDGFAALAAVYFAAQLEKKNHKLRKIKGRCTDCATALR